MKPMMAINMGLSAVDAVSDTPTKYRTAKTNKAKFDSILGNKPMTAAIKPQEPKLASDLIDELYKKAQEEKEDKKSLVPKAALAGLAALAIADAVVNKDILAPVMSVKSGVTSFAKKIPEIFSKAKGVPRSAKIFANAARVAKDNVNKEKRKKAVDIATAGIGFGTSAAIANLVVHALGDEYFEGNDKAKEIIRKSYENDQMIDPTGIHHFRKQVREAMKEKTASQIVDELYKEAAKFDTIGEYGKKVLIEDVAQNAIKSIPFVLTPIGASYLLNKNLKKDLSKVRGQDNQQTDRIVIEVPKDQVKLAGDYTPMPWKDFFKYELPSSYVRSLTWLLPATALTALTSRNFHSMGEKIQKDLPPVEKGKARISIYKNKGSSRQLNMDSKNM